MKIFTKHSEDEPDIEECDAVLLFSEHNGLTFRQIDYAIRAEFYKKPLFIATSEPMALAGEYPGARAWFYNTDSVYDAKLVLSAIPTDWWSKTAMGFSNTSLVSECLRLSGSPIETKLLLAMWHETQLLHVDKFTAQHTLGNYRADFAIMYQGHHVIVEADGHDFHERTKEQAQRDRQRDRDMQLMGWRVLRFTGSEIHRDAVGCARQVEEFLHALMRGVA